MFALFQGITIIKFKFELCIFMLEIPQWFPISLKK